jgi:NAD(P)-dependent dehydrogenase (short-subunit alcohol dehydrogenase family)
VIGLVFFTIALIPLLEKSSDKKVVNIASMLGDLEFTLKNPWLHFSSYSTTKAAVTLANAKFHLEFKDKGFIFLALNPGWVQTELAGEELAKLVGDYIILHKLRLTFKGTTHCGRVDQSLSELRATQHC